MFLSPLGERNMRKGRRRRRRREEEGACRSGGRLHLFRAKLRR
jgi:hypothetical protein